MRRVLCALGTLWAAPTSALGLVLAVLGGAKPYALRPALSWHWVPAWGFWAYWYRVGSPWGAITFGSITIINDAEADDERTIRHERRHTLQAWKLGPLFLPVYVLQWLTELPSHHGDSRLAYRSIPLEVAAYAAQERPDAWG